MRRAGRASTSRWSRRPAIRWQASTSRRACWPRPGRGESRFNWNKRHCRTLSYAYEFDAVITVDAMENIPPEDWPLVLANLHRAVRPGAVMYLTVEEVDQAEIDQAFQSLSARGLPVVRGEIIEGDVAGYHYYPGREQAAGWHAW
jgi:hypothetical protein